MEFRKVGDELHLLGKNNIPFYIFGKGYIKRYSLREYSYCRDVTLPGGVSLSGIFPTTRREELLPPLIEFYGEERGSLAAGLVGYNLWKTVSIPANYCFPQGRKFITYTTDYVGRLGDDFEIVNEEIEAESVGYALSLSKAPLIYHTYKFDDESLEGLTPILANDTIELYLGELELKVKVKGYPISNEFVVSGIEDRLNIRTCLSDVDRGKSRVIQFLNKCSLREQLTVLFGGYKSLIKIIDKVRIPGDKIITRWSKYFSLSETLRTLLIKNNKICSYKFLKEYLTPNRFNRDTRSLILQLGEETLNRLILIDAWPLEFLPHELTRNNIKEVREIINRYGPSFCRRNIFAEHRRYLELRNKFGKRTPVYPKTYNELERLTREFTEEERIKRESLPFKNKREELKWEGNDNMFVTVPISGSDLAKEGETLHHCVRTYIERVQQDLTNIVFIRKKAHPEKPFYTVEINNDNELIQIRGLQNRGPSVEVERFLKKYLAQLPPKK